MNKENFLLEMLMESEDREISQEDKDKIRDYLSKNKGDYIKPFIKKSKCGDISFGLKFNIRM